MSAAMVIAGAGECGARAATELRAAGWPGPIELLGAESRLPYERPPLSKAALLSDESPDPVTVYDAAALRDAEITHRSGVAVTHIDRERREVVSSDGERIRYERLLLATGAAPRTLPITASGPRTYTLRTFDDLLRLRNGLRPGARVAVIGGGFIGLELAAAARYRGCEVTVLEVADRLLCRAVPAAVAARVHARHIEAGVTIRCGVRPVEAGAGPDGANVVVLAGGDIVEYDALVIGIGAVPETGLAERAGLAVDNGIAVDTRLRTSDPRIFAAGDCCSVPHPVYDGGRVRLESWRNAHDQAVVAARNMVGRECDYDAVPWFWSDQYELSLQVAGLPTMASAEVVRVRPDDVAIHFGLDDLGRLVSAAAVGRGNAVAKDIRLCEMAIARRAVPDRAELADPSVNLKQFLR